MYKKKQGWGGELMPGFCHLVADHDKLLLGALVGTVAKSHKLRRDTQGLDHRAFTSSYGCYYELYIFFLEIMYYCGVFFYIYYVFYQWYI